MDKSKLRASIFRHLDGIVMAPVVAVLAKHNTLDAIQKTEKFDIDEFSSSISANAGYLNVALRVLASQGFLNYTVDNKQNKVSISLSDRFEKLLEFQEVYQDLNAFITAEETIRSAQVSDGMCQHWWQLFQQYKEWLLEDIDEQDIRYQVQKHIEGCLIGPVIVRLGMSGLFHNYFMQSRFSADEFHKNPEYFGKVLDGLAQMAWFRENKGFYEFTEQGLFFAKRAASYGVTVSYLPMFAALEELIFGDAAAIRNLGQGEEERHVDRAMNVWGSGGAHHTYFKVIDELIIEIFNRPIEEQPKGILDMGCGNGALLQHLYEIIERFTLRGKMLEEHPLFLVGADYNQAALKATRANLVKHEIWAKVIWGDIGDPDTLAAELKEVYKIDLSSLLNMRSFLDHNRIWEPADAKGSLSSSTGAFAFRGQRLANNEVEASLKQHLEKWKPYVHKHGLLLIELHTIAPALTAANLGKTAATAYDATHGFSDQYIVELEVFNKVCAEVGLQAEPRMVRRFPDSELATVSINLFKQ